MCMIAALQEAEQAGSMVRVLEAISIGRYTRWPCTFATLDRRGCWDHGVDLGATQNVSSDQPDQIVTSSQSRV